MEIIRQEIVQRPSGPPGITLGRLRGDLRLVDEQNDEWITEQTGVAFEAIERYAQYLWLTHSLQTTMEIDETEEWVPALPNFRPLQQINSTQEWLPDTNSWVSYHGADTPQLDYDHRIKLTRGVWRIWVNAGQTETRPDEPLLYECVLRLLAWALETRGRVSWGSLHLSGVASLLARIREDRGNSLLLAPVLSPATPAFTRRIAVSDNTPVLAADIIATSARGQADIIQSPDWQGDKFVAVWVSGSRSLSEISIAGTNYLNVFSPGPLTVGEVPGTRYQSNIPLGMLFSSVPWTIR